MNELEKLLAKREAISKEFNELAVQDGDWSPDGELQKRFNAKEQELSSLDNRITKLRAHAENAMAPVAKPVAGVTDTGHTLEVGEDLETKKPWESLGHQLMAIKEACRPRGNVDKRLLAATGSSGAVDSDAGYLIQQDAAQQIMTAAIGGAQIAARCDRVSVSGDRYTGVEFVDDTTASNTFFGGIQVYWVDEGGTATPTKPKTRRIERRLGKLMGLWYCTNEALSDAAQLSSMARTAFPQAMGYVLDDAILNGDGAGKPLGIFNANNPALIQVAKETGQAAATVVWDNVRHMKNRVRSTSMRNVAIVHNEDVADQLEQMVFPIGTGGVPVFLPPGGLSEDGYARMYGRPLIPVEQCPALGSVGDIGFVDFNEYLIIDKAGEGLKEDVSIHVAFLTNEQVFRWTWRINGMPKRSNVYTPANSSTTRSPFVALAARS